MAKTGSITISPGSYSIPNNSTPVTITGKITTTGESYRGDSRTGTITVTQNGTNIYSGTFTHGAPANSTTTLFSISLTVKHYNDGSSGTIAASYNYDSGWCSASASTTLTKIPRQATLTSAPNFNDEGNPTINYSNPAGTAVTSLQACISLTGASADIAYRDINKTGTSYTFNLTDAERAVLRKATLSGSNSRTVKFFVRTIIGGNTYHSILDKTFTVINCAPTLSPTVYDTNILATKLTGSKYVFIKGYSNVVASTGALAVKEASITSQSITCNNKTSHTSSVTLNAVESGTFTFTATDNRGNTTTQTVVKDLIDYIKLTCNMGPEHPTVDGDFEFSAFGNYFSESFGAVANSLQLEWRYKIAGQGYPKDDAGNDIWTSFTNIEYTDTGYRATANISGLDYRTAYVFQVRAADKIYSEYIETTERVVRALPAFDWSEKDFNFNVQVFKEGNPMGYYPIGGIYTSSNNTDPGELFGGIWELERRFYGGELLAYGTAWNDGVCSFQGISGNDYGFSDSLYGGTFASHIQNYLPDIITPSSGTLWVQTKGVVGLVEAHVEISGGNSGCVGIWFLKRNKNELPASVTLTGGQGLIALNGSYSGASTRYFYNIKDNDTNSTFFINPVWKPYNGNFNPGIAGTKSTLHVKAYAKGKVTYMWKRVA